MTTVRTTITDPGTGETANVYAQTKLPSNLSEKDIDIALAKTSKTLEMEKGKLSSHGKTLVDDTQALIDTTRKNELFQKLFAFAKKTPGVEGLGVPSQELQDAGRTLVERVTGMASALQTDAEDLAGYIRGEIYNYLTSEDYRDIMSDFYHIIKELAAEIDSEIESEMEESEESLKDKGEQKEEQRPRKLKQDRPVVGSQGWKKQGAWNKPLELPSEFSTTLQGQVQQKMENEGVEKFGSDQPKPKFPSTEGELKKTEDVKQRAEGDVKRKTKEAEDKAVEELQDHVNNLLSKIADKEEYQSLVKNFFKFSDEINDVMMDVSEDVQRTPEARQARELLDNAYEILSDFAGKKRVETYRKDWNKLFDKIQNDKELKKWREQSRDYVLQFLKNPDASDKTVEQLKGLIQDGRRILQKYRSLIDTLYDDQVKIAQAIKNDPSLQDFNTKLSNLGSHLVMNERGEIDPSRVQESMIQIANLVGGLFHDYLATLPLTRIDIKSENYDLSMSDIKLRGTGFAPDKVEIKTRSNTTLHFVQGQTNKSSFLVSFSVANVCPVFEDFEYSFTKKSFPAYSDAGRASISCSTNDGLNIEASILIKSVGTNSPKAYLKSLWVRLGILSIETAQEQHPVLTPLLAPFYAESVRQRIESLVYNQIHTRMHDVIVQLNEFFVSRPLERVTQQIGTAIQSNLPSLSVEEKNVKQPVEQRFNKP